MGLKVQLLTIFFSFVFGIFFYLAIYLNRKILFQKSLIKRIISNLLFIIDMVLIYFIILKYANDGILNYYSYIFMIIGMIMEKYIVDKIKTYKK